MPALYLDLTDLTNSVILQDNEDLPISKSKFKNEHLSVSRLERYEQCPLSFELRYIKHLPRLSGNNATDFGLLLHDTLEMVYRWIVDEEYSGPIPIHKVTECFRNAWEERKFVGLELYHEGLQIIRAYAESQPPVDHFDVLDIEKEFNIQVGEFLVNGYIDRLDKVNDTTAKIVDYKSNRLLYTSGQLEANLQMSVYAIAVTRAYPWVRHIEFEFHMLRHGFPMRTTRSLQQIQDAADYVVYLGRRTENSESYPANLNLNCGYCDVRHHCSEFQKATDLKQENVGFPVDSSDSLVLVAQERERVASLAKLFYKRKEDLEAIIKMHLDTRESIEIGGFLYSLHDWNAQRTYPIDGVVRTTQRVLGHPPEETLRDLCTIDPKKIPQFLDRMADLYPKGRVLLLKAELEALEMKIAGNPKFNSKRTKEAPPVSVDQNPQVKPKARRASLPKTLETGTPEGSDPQLSLPSPRRRSSKPRVSAKKTVEQMD